MSHGATRRAIFRAVKTPNHHQNSGRQHRRDRAGLARPRFPGAGRAGLELVEEAKGMNIQLYLHPIDG
jgi:hypothetical protein